MTRKSQVEAHLFGRVEVFLVVAGILGVGNGDPVYRATERPSDSEARIYEVRTFNGFAQVLLKSTHNVGTATLFVEGDGLKGASLQIEIKP